MERKNHIKKLLNKMKFQWDRDSKEAREITSQYNYIGASTIVITKDNCLIIGKQGDYSRANAGRYAPSGSGSVNYSDLKLSNDFNSIIINAMEREFCEENNYSSNNKIKTIIIGYARLLERGGKPDFLESVILMRIQIILIEG